MISNLKESFDKVQCIDVVKNQQLCFVKNDQTVSDVCRVLVDTKISSVPVFDEKANRFVGLLDYQDLLDLILKSFHNKQKAQSGMVRDVLGDKNVCAQDIVDLSKRDPFITIPPESSLNKAIEVMKTGVHRICLMDQNSTMNAVFSQSDILKYVATRPDLMDMLDKISIRDQPFFSKTVPTVYTDDSLYLAFGKMSQHGHSSMAVVDRENRLVGTISVKDVRHVLSFSVEDLMTISCEKFVSMNLFEQGLETGKDLFPYFHILPDSTLGHAIRKILAVKTHRIWVAENAVPLGLVTMTDICAFFASK